MSFWTRELRGLGLRYFKPFTIATRPPVRGPWPTLRGDVAAKVLKVAEGVDPFAAG